MELIALSLTDNVRREKLDGRQYLVADASMIVPGVLNGSQGALYYPVDEVSKNPGIWNGVPVTINHPFDDLGNNVSARDPKVEKKFRIGTVYNDRFSNGKRRAEVWLDEELTKNKAPEVYKLASQGQPIELSTGLFTDNEPVKNGKSPDGREYQFIARNYRPDHLAILPNQTGACSLKDGCGLNVNQDVTSNAWSDEARQAAAEARSRGYKKTVTSADMGQGSGKFVMYKHLEGHGLRITSSGSWDHMPAKGVAKSGKPGSLGAHLGKFHQTTNTEVTSVTNEKRTLLSQLAAMLGFKVNPVSNAKKKSEDDGDDRESDEDDITENAWSDEARAASAEARAASKKAMESGSKKDHMAASKAHSTAASFKKKFSSNHTEHLMQASYHSMLAKSGKDVADKASGKGAPTEIRRVSNTKKVCNDDADADGDNTDDMTDNGKDHEEPDADDMGGPSDGDEDNKKKKPTTTNSVNNNNSSNGDDMDRKKLVSWLTTNCDCHKGKEKVLANQDNYSDEELRKLKTNAEKAMRDAQFVANASTDNPDSAPDPNDDDADDEQEGNKNGMKGIKGPKDAKLAKVKGGSMASNMTLAQFEQNMPPAAQAIWNAAKEVEQSERVRLVGVVTANIQDVARKQVLTNKLMDRNRTTLEDLRDLASAIPQRQVRNHQVVIPNYFGNQPGAQQTQTNNSNLDDVLELPTLNWEEIAKSGDVRTRV